MIIIIIIIIIVIIIHQTLLLCSKFSLESEFNHHNATINNEELDSFCQSLFCIDQVTMENIDGVCYVNFGRLIVVEWRAYPH